MSCSLSSGAISHHLLMQQAPLVCCPCQAHPDERGCLLSSINPAYKKEAMEGIAKQSPSPSLLSSHEQHRYHSSASPSSSTNSKRPPPFQAQSKLVTFVFGDSLTDVGNNNFLPYSLAKSDYPWYGIDYETGFPTGRFTNGRTIGDIISAKLGIQSPPPYLSLSMDKDDILHGVNYASGGAGILNETGIYFVEKLSFDDQINCFQKTAEAIRAKIGWAASKRLLNEAVYFIGLGSNDYVNNFLQPFLVDAQIYTHDEFLSLLSMTLDGQIKRLYSLGARKILFHGLGPMGCIPSQRVHSADGECLELLNEWALQFNYRVRSLMTSLNSELAAALFSFSDSYNIVLDLIKNPQSYGFKISNTSCCNVDTTVGGLCLPNSKLCADRREYVFWDACHPTDAANQVIADRLFAASSPPSPSFPHH